MSISNMSNSSRPGVCTSTTRPITPYEGQMIYETDTDRVLLWNGSQWYANWNLPWGVVSLTTSTSGSSFAGNTANLTSSSFTSISGRRYKITYTEPQVQISADAYSVSTIRYTNASGTTLQSGFYIMRNGFPTSFNTVYVGTLNSGSIVIAGCNVSSVGTTTLSRSSSVVAQLIVEDVGPA